MLSQCQMILNDLQKGIIIDTPYARKHYDCERLASRIGELRKLGFPIKTITIRRNGKKYARYSMRKVYTNREIELMGKKPEFLKVGNK